MIRIQLVTALLLTLLLAGCATMDKSECREADWTIVGLEDGAKGRPLSYISRHRKSCAEYGVSPDLARYKRGHGDGLKQFCTPENGYRIGRAGRSYDNVCPTMLSGQFLAGYQTGLELHGLSTDINRMQSDVRGMKAELSRISQRQQNVENLLVSGTLSASVKQSLLDEFKKMQTDIAALQISIRENELEAARLQGEYDLLNASHPY